MVFSHLICLSLNTNIKQINKTCHKVILLFRPKPRVLFKPWNSNVRKIYKSLYINSIGGPDEKNCSPNQLLEHVQHDEVGVGCKSPVSFKRLTEFYQEASRYFTKMTLHRILYKKSIDKKQHSNLVRDE